MVLKDKSYEGRRAHHFSWEATCSYVFFPCGVHCVGHGCHGLSRRQHKHAQQEALDHALPQAEACRLVTPATPCHLCQPRVYGTRVRVSPGVRVLILFSVASCARSLP